MNIESTSLEPNNKLAIVTDNKDAETAGSSKKLPLFSYGLEVERRALFWSRKVADGNKKDWMQNPGLSRIVLDDMLLQLEHWPLYLAQGKEESPLWLQDAIPQVLLITTKPVAMRSALRKQWLRRKRYLERQRSMFLATDTRRAETDLLLRLWEYFAETSLYIYAEVRRGITVATKYETLAQPPTCKLLYVREEEITGEELYLIAGYMPKGSKIILLHNEIDSSGKRAIRNKYNSPFVQPR